MELTPVVAVPLAALVAHMLAVLTMLAGFTLGTFAALTFLVFALVVVDLYDMIWRDAGDGRALKSRCPARRIAQMQMQPVRNRSMLT